MDTTLQNLIGQYGYLAVFVGTFLEGETVLMIGGFSAHQGHLALPWVVVAAFCGSLMGDQAYFYLGRRHGSAVLARRPQWASRIDRARRLITRHQTLFILAMRFMYGLRIAGPVVLGMSTFSAKRFFMLNMAGAAIWAVVFGTAGYLLGEALKTMLGHIQHIEAEIMIAIAVTGAFAWAVHLSRYRVR